MQLSSPGVRHGVERGLAYLVEVVGVRELRCFGGEGLGNGAVVLLVLLNAASMVYKARLSAM